MIRFLFTTLIGVILSLSVHTAYSQDDDADIGDHAFKGLELRGIGPAITSGRISDFAFNPERHHEYYVATASGNLWKTGNNGITWSAVFDNEGSYGIGVRQRAAAVSQPDRVVRRSEVHGSQR